MSFARSLGLDLFRAVVSDPPVSLFLFPVLLLVFFFLCGKLLEILQCFIRLESYML